MADKLFFSGNRKNRVYELFNALGLRIFFLVVFGIVIASIVELANIYFIYNIFEAIASKKDSIDLSVASLFFISVDILLFLKFFCVFIVIYFSSIFFSAHIVARYSFDAAARISSHIFNVNLNSREMLKNTSGSNLISLCLNDASRVGSGIILAALNILSRSLIIIFIAAFLFFVNGVFASASFFVLIFIYGAGYLFMRPFLSNLGADISSSFQERSRLSGFALNAFRSEVVAHRRDSIVVEFYKQTQAWASANVWIATVSVVPRAFVELGVLLACLGFGIYFVGGADSVNVPLEHYVPQFAAFGVAFMRLYPSFQQLFANLVNFRASIVALENIAITLQRVTGVGNVLDWRLPVVYGLPTDVMLECKNIGIRLGKEHLIVCPEFTLKKKSAIVLKGPSGIGKSTIMDAILGLRAIDRGYVGWAEDLDNKVQYLGSEPYFFGSSLEQEMQWRGLSRHPGLDLRIEKLWRDFSLSEDLKPASGWPSLSFASLSRGERQRVSIILSILQNPGVLVLDEALSGCGADLEVKVIRKILSLDISVLMITHSRHVVDRFHSVKIACSR